jgi:uncharacterized membrane protein
VDDSELERLTARVDALEREVAQLRYGASTPGAPVPRTETIVPQPVAAAPAAPAPRRDVESGVGGRGLLYVGSLLILIGVASFLKIAFDRGWVGPSMRVALGLIAAAAIVGVASALRKRLHPYFADALVGLGAAIGYLSLYAAGSLFHLLPLSVVSLGTIVVTGALCVLAYRQDRQPLAFFGIIGGLIAPLLLSGDGNDSLFFYTYLAVLSSAAIVLGELRGWRALPIVSLIGTALYWMTFSLEGDATKFAERFFVGIVLYVLFATSMLVAWRRRENIDGWRIAVAALNAVWFFVGITILAQGHDVALAILYLAIAAAHIIAGRLWNQRQQFWLATIAISFAIPAIAYSFAPAFTTSDKFVPAIPAAIPIGMHLAWIIEATLVGVLGARWNDRVLLVLSGTLFATVVVNVIAGYALDDLRILLNDRFISLAGSAIGIAIVRRETTQRGVAGGKFNTLVKVATDLIVVFALTMEASRIGNQLQSHLGGGGGSLAVSVVWALYGAALIVFGIRLKDTVSRWDGLVLLAITVLKVLIVDLTNFDIVVRVISALGLGAVMLVVAFLYQSRLRAAKSGE